MPVIVAASWTSRTVPTNEAIAPTPRSAARSRAISAPMSKSPVCTRAVITRDSAAGDRRKDRDLVAVGNRLRTRDDTVIDGEPNRAPCCELHREGAAACAQGVDQRIDRRIVCRQFEDFSGAVKRLTQPRQIDNANAKPC